MQMFTPRFLVFGSASFIFANILLGMILMVIVNSLLTGHRGKDRNFLILALFFTGTFINAVFNLYTRFIITTAEPYIGSWLSIFAFVLFVENYLEAEAVLKRRTFFGIVKIESAVFFLLSSLRENLIPDESRILVDLMDIFAALTIAVLLGLLIFLRIKGSRRAGSLILFECFMVAGAVSAMGLFKDFVVGPEGVPGPFLQGNLFFLIGMTVNGLLFSFILGGTMTDIKVKAAVTAERNRELEELDRAKTDFIMNVSHELRTPVAIISGTVKQLKKGRWGDSLSGVLGQLDVIERSNERLYRQITNLLDLSLLEQREYVFSPGLVDPERQISSIVDEFEPLASDRGIALSCEPSETGGRPALLRADPHLLDVAVLNLLTNALKFTPEGGRVTVKTESADGGRKISVTDTGPGLSEAERKKIFRRFHQTETSSGSWRGTGIGLSLVKEVMELHGGAVRVEMRPGGGSIFILEFPAVRVDAGSFPETAPRERVHDLLAGYKADLRNSFDAETGLTEGCSSVSASGTSESSGQKAQVLVVEDDPDLRNYLRTELESDFEVLLAGNGREALERLGLETPSLIISDIMMPELNGHQLFEAVQKEERTAAVPFLFLTARDSAVERLESLKGGAVDYIEKPFSAEELSARVRAIIGQGQAERKYYRAQLKESLVDFIDSWAAGEKAAADRSKRGGTSEPHQPGFDLLCTEKDLTPRETEIAALLRKGKSDKEIAAHLSLSAKTVGNYNTAIFRKFGVSGRLELMSMGR